MNVLIDSFAPFHNGHLQVIEAVLAEGAGDLTLVIGSAGQPRSLRCPFTVAERKRMITESLASSEAERVSILDLPDDRYRPKKWASDLSEILVGRGGLCQIESNLEDSDYFPKLTENTQFLSAKSEQASQVRAAWLQRRRKALLPLVPPAVLALLREWQASLWYEELCEEQEFVDHYRQAWKDAPYAPVFVTLDALVKAGDTILVIERGNRPGAGLMALPGGFLDANETLLAGCLRELDEETGLKLTQESLVTSGVFAEPARSIRGRTVTHAFRFDIGETQPQVSGGDDAASAYWLKIAELDRAQFFEDHYEIVLKLLDG